MIPLTVEFSCIFVRYYLYLGCDPAERGDLLQFLELNENQLCLRVVVCSEI